MPKFRKKQRSVEDRAAVRSPSARRKVSSWKLSEMSQRILTQSIPMLNLFRVQIDSAINNRKAKARRKFAILKTAGLQFRTLLMARLFLQGQSLAQQRLLQSTPRLMRLADSESSGVRVSWEYWSELQRTVCWRGSRQVDRNLVQYLYQQILLLIEESRLKNFAQEALGLFRHEKFSLNDKLQLLLWKGRPYHDSEELEIFDCRRSQSRRVRVWHSEVKVSERAVEQLLKFRIDFR